MKHYHTVASEISVQDGLLMRGSRVVIPSALRLEMLDRIHTGHQGISKCRERAKQSLWWPGLSRQLEELVKNCSTCRKCLNQRREPLIPTALPELPWQRVGTDLFEFRGHSYLLVVDYYSRFIEIARLDRTTSEEIILQTKKIFARYGIPEVVVSDNGPQYSSEAYAAFAWQFQFEHVTSSLHYPQSNGEAEHAVQMVKNLPKKEGDLYLALLPYRSTPLKCELLMARKLRTNVPITWESLKPTVPDLTGRGEGRAILKVWSMQLWPAPQSKSVRAPLSWTKGLGDRPWWRSWKASGSRHSFVSGPDTRWKVSS